MRVDLHGVGLGVEEVCQSERGRPHTPHTVEVVEVAAYVDQVDDGAAPCGLRGVPVKVDRRRCHVGHLDWTDRGAGQICGKVILVYSRACGK